MLPTYGGAAVFQADFPEQNLSRNVDNRGGRVDLLAIELELAQVPGPGQK
jgi:hypothetical protein